MVAPEGLMLATWEPSGSPQDRDFGAGWCFTHELERKLKSITGLPAKEEGAETGDKRGV